MKLNDYLRKQKRKHILYTLLPLIFCMESVAALQIYNVKHKYLIFIVMAAGIIQTALIIVHTYLIIRFMDKLRKCNIDTGDMENEWLYIGDAAVNSRFIIKYGYFKKNIYTTDNAVKAYAQENSYYTRKAFAIIKRIIILREGQPQIVIKAALTKGDYVQDLAVMTINEFIRGKQPDDLDKVNKMTYYAFPFYGYFLPALFGVILIAMEIKHNLINVFVDKSDICGRLLFHMGYDKILMSVSIMLVIIFAVISYYLKYKYIGINTDSVLVNFIIPGIMLIGLYLYISVQQFDYGEVSKAARKDFSDYYHGRYEKMYVSVTGSNNFFYENKNSGVYNLTHKFGLTIEKYYIDDEKEQYLLEFAEYDCERENGRYEAEYLKHTRLIVKIARMED